MTLSLTSAAKCPRGCRCAARARARALAGVVVAAVVVVWLRYEVSPPSRASQDEVWLGFDETAMGLEEEEAHFSMSNFLHEPFGEDTYQVGGLQHIYDIVRDSDHLNPGRREDKDLEFSFINLVPATLAFIQGILATMSIEDPSVRGAWLIWATMCSAMISDKTWKTTVSLGQNLWRGPARMLFYEKGSRNAPHWDMKLDGRLLIVLANDPWKRVADLFFWNRSLHRVLRVPRFPFSGYIAGDTMMGCHFTQNGRKQLLHGVPPAPQLTATLALNPRWNSREPGALAGEFAKFREMVREIYEGVRE